MSEKEDNRNSGNNGEIRKELKEFLSEIEAKKEEESQVEREAKEGKKIQRITSPSKNQMQFSLR